MALRYPSISYPNVSMPSPRSSGLDKIRGGITAGMQLQGAMTAMQEKKKQREILRMLGDPDSLTEEKFYEIAQYDPQLATQMYAFHSNMQMAKANKKDANIKAAWNFVDRVNEVGMDFYQILKDLPEEQRQQAFMKMVQPLMENEELRPYAQAITAEFIDPETGQFNSSDEHLRMLPFHIQAADTLRKAEQASMVREAETEAAKEEATHESGLQREENRLKLEQQQENAMELAKFRAQHQTPSERQKPVEQRAQETIADARGMGIELSFAQALVIIDPRRLPKSVGVDGQEVLTDFSGNPIDMKPVNDYIRQKTGGKAPEGEAALPQGSPSLINQRLSAPANPAPAAAPTATATVPTYRRQPPDDPYLQRNPW